jgi:phosphinothricin acetyltransferase
VFGSTRQVSVATTDILIRSATRADAAAITAIYNQAVLGSTATFDLEPETVTARRLWLRSAGTRLCLVAEIGERVVGWSSLSRWSPRGGYDRTVEASIYVAPETQRAGVGLALAGAALEAAPGLNVHAVIAQICAENSAGLALADALGFARVGTLHEVGRKFGRPLDVVICERLV